jgi:DNA-binding HxlR family transcriptional regulator
MTVDQNDSFNVSKAETFEALGHPTRIRILQILSERPLPFTELKRAAGIESNGLLSFHLGKLKDLVKLNAAGSYAVTDEGREALRVVDASRTGADRTTRRGRSLSIPHPRAVIAALLIVILVLSSIAVIQQYQVNELNHSLDNITSHDQNALLFGSSLSTTTTAQGQTLVVYLADLNTLDSKNSLPLSSGPLAMNLSSPPCSSFPGGIAVYEGAYDLGNVSSATRISLYASNFYDCGNAPITDSFTFGPLQNVTTSFDLAGYYDTSGTLRAFLPGIYTVVSGDEWGNVKVMHFHVAAPPLNLERTGPVSSFPASWLTPCNESASGNVTTALYLGLNSTSALDHINLNQVYAQILSSAGFDYDSAGRGWVVSEWFERGPSENNAIGGQVVASFILTSGGVPSGYVLAAYDLAGGAVSVTASAVQTTSCSG